MTKNEKKMTALGDLYVSEQALWNISNRDDNEITKRKINFLEAHSELIEAYLNENHILSAEAEDHKRRLDRTGFVTDALIVAGIPSEIAYVIADYKHINRDKTAIKKENEALDEPVAAPVNPITREQWLKQKQREGLHEFQRWLYRNGDGGGKEYFGSKGSPREYIEHNFLQASEDVQKRTLFYLERGLRKKNNEERVSQANEAGLRTYVPKLVNLKPVMLAYWLKVWKRVDGSGSKYYWNKLEDAFEKAKYDDARMRNRNLDAFNRPDDDADTVHGTTKTEDAKDLAGEFTKTSLSYDKLEQMVVGSHNTKKVSDGEEVDKDLTLKKEIMEIAPFKEYTEKLLTGVGTFNNVATVVAGPVNIFKAGKAVYDNAKDSYKNHEQIRLSEGTQMLLDSAEQTAGAVVTGTGLVKAGTAVYNSALGLVQKVYKKASEIGEKFIDKTTHFLSAAGLALASIQTINSYYKLIKSGRAEDEAKKAVNLVDNLQNPDKEKIRRRGLLIKKLWERNVPSMMHGAVAGALGIGAGILATFTVGVPVLGQIVGIFAAAAYFLGEYVINRMPDRGKKRDAIDEELVKDENGDIERKKQVLAEKIQARLDPQNGLKPEVKEKIKKYLSVTEENGHFTVKSSHMNHHLGNIIRREAAADHNYMFMDQAYNGVLQNIAKEAMDNVYGKRGNGAADLSREQGAIVDANRALLKSMGVATEGLDERVDNNEPENATKKEKTYKALSRIKI